jgi:hypothetical protein
VQLFSRDGAASVAELVKEPEFRSLAIYEPGVLGPFRSLFRSLPRYTVSDFWPDVPAGQERDGVRCESLMGLTHADGIFDLVITSDIFEHVRHPYKGFAEVARVLRKGGAHVFSIPVLHPLAASSVARVDTSGPEDVHVLEPRYHLGPGNSQHIVYTDFGADLCERLADVGLSTEAVRFPSPHGDLNRVVTFYSIKQE